MSVIVPRDYAHNCPFIETTEGVLVCVSYSQTVEGAQRQAEILNQRAERMSLTARYRVRGVQ